MTETMDTAPTGEQLPIREQTIQEDQNGEVQRETVTEVAAETGPPEETEPQTGTTTQTVEQTSPTATDGQEASQTTSDGGSPNKASAACGPSHHLTVEERVTILMAIAIAAKEYHPGEQKAKIGPDLCEYVRYLLEQPFFRGRVRKLSKNEFGRSPSNSTIISIYKHWYKDNQVAPLPRGGSKKSQEKLKKLEGVVADLTNKGDKMSIRKVAIEAGLSHAFVSRYFKDLVKPKAKSPVKKKTPSPKKTNTMKRKAKSPKKK